MAVICVVLNKSSDGLSIGTGRQCPSKDFQQIFFLQEAIHFFKNTTRYIIIHFLVTYTPLASCILHERSKVMSLCVFTLSFALADHASND